MFLQVSSEIAHFSQKNIRKCFKPGFTKSLHIKSLRFAIFWEILENCQLKTSVTKLENSSNRNVF